MADARVLFFFLFSSFLFGWPTVTRSDAGARLLLSCRTDLWWISCREGGGQSRSNKIACRIAGFADRGSQRSHLPLAGRGGEGWKRLCCFSSTSAELVLLHYRAPHAVVLLAAAIYGHDGGQSSSSSPAEVFGVLHRSSTDCGFQVVRPRRSLSGRWRWLVAGSEKPSICLQHLGVSCAWRSSATRGGGTQGLDCVFPF